MSYMVNVYVRQYKFGAGSYGKVVSIILMTLFCVFLLQWVIYLTFFILFL
jgi:hypothetical protein